MFTQCLGQKVSICWRNNIRLTATLYLCVLLLVLFMHPRRTQLDGKAPPHILNMIDDKLNESEPGTIHVFQVISGYNGNQMFVPFLKSLIINHFFTRKSSDPAAEPIHLHLVTDTKSRLELEGILASWRITDFLYTFYAIEPLQHLSSWLRTYHGAGPFAVNKMYLSTLLNSTVPKIIAMDPDTLFLTDISELWKEFKKFSPNQFYAMAADQAPTRYNFPKVYGWRFTEGYNGGLVLWYASRAPQEKWDAIWKPVFANFDKPKIFLPAAEQTVMTLTAILNPEIFYALDCTWNLQLSFDCKPYNCLSKWTSSDPNAPKPKVMHGSGAGKQFGKFALEKPKHPLVNLNQFRKAFVYERSLLLLHNDYAFRRRIERNEPFDFRKIIDTLHSTGKFLTASELCKMNWRMLTKLCELNEEFSYTTERIIYPIYICPDFERMSFHTDGITLVMGLEITQLDTLEQAIVQWEGRISVALEATTAEAFRFIEAHKKSSILSRQNIRYHFVLQNQTMQTESVLHNTAVAYSITNRVLIPIGDDADLGEIFEVLQLDHSTGKSGPLLVLNARKMGRLNQLRKYNLCSSKYGNWCLFVVNRENLEIVQEFAENASALIISTRKALLPNQVSRQPTTAHILTLLANTI